MARLTSDGSHRLEQAEGELACLGNALVLLSLVRVRLDQARAHGGLDALLSPAQEDLRRVESLVERAQVSLACRLRRG